MSKGRFIEVCTESIAGLGLKGTFRASVGEAAVKPLNLSQMRFDKAPLLHHV